VTALMAAHPDPRIRVTVVPTFVDLSVWQRLTVGVYGMLRATWLVLRCRTDVLHLHMAHGGSVIPSVSTLSKRMPRSFAFQHIIARRNS